jgi:hypothetical protein
MTNNKKHNPYLFLRYNQGLGDFVASLLHSKILGWLTKLITGKSEPCKVCSKRADALNVLFPIPFWRLFFKDQKEMYISLNKDLLAAGFQTDLAEDGSFISSMESRVEFKSPIPATEISSVIVAPKDEKMSKYVFLSSNEREIDHILIRTEIYKLKS